MKTQKFVRIVVLGSIGLGLGLIAGLTPSDSMADATAGPGGEKLVGSIVVPADDPARDPRMVAQADALAFADKITLAADREPGSGFAGMYLEADSVKLYWKGDLPSEIDELISSSPVEIVVQEVQFSREEFDKASRSMIFSPPTSLASAGVIEVGPTADFSSLEVLTKTPVVSALAPRATPEGIPIQFGIGTPAKALATRHADIPSFWGGARMLRRTGIKPGTNCTTGFTVLKNTNGQPAILTARHCLTAEWFTPPGERVGNTNLSYVDDVRDAMIIESESYEPSIYSGPWTADRTSRRAVVSAANPVYGTYVYHSGAFSGAHTLLIDTPPDRYTTIQWANGHVQRIGRGFWAHDPEGHASTGEGDSGGPVASNYNGEFARITARGSVSAGNVGTEGPCLGYAWPDRVCYRRSFHVTIQDITASLAVRVDT